MILRPGYYYSFLRTNYKRHMKEREDINNKYPYFGEILSDSWGNQNGNPIEKFMWDEDSTSGDFWKYEDIYPELLFFVNSSIKEGYHIDICESDYDINKKPNDYLITDNKESLIKLDDPCLSHFTVEDKNIVMSSPYGQYFAFFPHRPYISEEKIKLLRGKPFFGDKTWKIGDMCLYCFIQKDNDLHMVGLSHLHIKELEDNYTYVKMSSHVPVFEKKGN